MRGFMQLYKDFSLKMKVIAWMDFEHAYFKTVFTHVSHNAAGTPLVGF